MFTQKQVFASHKLYFCRNRGRKVRCVPGSSPPTQSPGGERGTPGVCLNIYHILASVCLLERAMTIKEKVLFKLVRSVLLWFVRSHLRSPAGTPASPCSGCGRDGPHTATWWLPPSHGSSSFFPLDGKGPCQGDPTIAHARDPEVG